MCRLHGQVVKGVEHIGHDEAMEAGGREFVLRPVHYSRFEFLIQPGNCMVRFSYLNVPFFQNSVIILNIVFPVITGHLCLSSMK